MSSFPLYDTIINQQNHRKLTDAQKSKLVAKINAINNNGAGLVYALIRTYEMRNTEKCDTYKLPYEGVYINGDVQFDLDNFPIVLQRLLHFFILKHTKANEDEKRK